MDGITLMLMADGIALGAAVIGYAVWDSMRRTPSRASAYAPCPEMLKRLRWMREDELAARETNREELALIATVKGGRA